MLSTIQQEHVMTLHGTINATLELIVHLAELGALMPIHKHDKE